MPLKYKRAVLKLSGEALGGGSGQGIDFAVAETIATAIAAAVRAGAQLGIVVGGGNIWRGRQSGTMDAVRADQMGMLATIINTLALADVLEQRGQPVLVQTAQAMPQVAGCVHKPSALQALSDGKVVLFGGGTGNPFCTTDSAAALRAAEIEAEVVLKATNVDGVYDKDPRQHPDAKRFAQLCHDEILAHRLAVMDAAAAALCREQNLPMLVFNLRDPNDILRALQGEPVGTLVISDKK